MKKRWISALLVMAMMLSLVPGIPLPVRADTQTESVQTMKVSDEMIAVLKKMEGFSGVAFWDYAQWTIGYGTRCPAGKENYYTKENPLTEEEAVVLLHEELAGFENSVNKFAKKHGLILSQHQFDALVSFSYNVGGSWMNSTGNTLVKAILNGNNPEEFIYAMCLWSRAGSDFILQRRRLSEANMYLNGVYKAYNTSGGVPSNYRYVFLDGNGADVTYVIHGFDANLASKPVTVFTSIPTGVDENGVPFVYEFAGWYTARTEGTLVSVLDSSVPTGSILYAQWKDPAGNIVSPPVGEQVGPLEVTVGSAGVQARSGYGTYYSKLEKLAAGTVVTVTATYKNSTLNWGLCEHGWINLGNTNYSDVLASLPPDTTLPEEGVSGTVTGNRVNIRKGPGTSYGIAGKAYEGDAITIYEIAYDGSTYYWGRMNQEGTKWICLDYVEYDTTVVPTVVSVEVLRLPDDLEYVQMQDNIDLAGSVLKVVYSDGTIFAKTIQNGNISGFGNAELGTNTVTVSYGGASTTFTVEIIKATVTFLHSDGTVLSSAQYAYGETVAVPADPVKPEDENGKYIFVGWDQEVTTCNGDAVYTAVFRPCYTVTFLNYDGTVLSSAQYAYGETVAVPDNPVKPEDENGKYMFVGWDSEVTACNADAVYTAVFLPCYTVTFLNYDGTELSRVEYALGGTVIPPEVPAKPADEQGEYVFAGWDKEVTVCQGNTVYTAVFQLKKYTVTFQNYDGSVLSTNEYLKGETVAIPADPIKPEDESGEYLFVGWDKEVTVCQGDTVYTAVFQLKKYTVTFLNCDGTVLSTQEYYKGETVVVPANPTKPDGNDNEYSFIGWDKEVTACQGDAVYTAVFQSKKYEVIFYNYDGSVISSNKYYLNETVVAPDTPVKPADEFGSYEFVGWDKEILPCAGDAAYTAVYRLMGDADTNGIVNSDDAIYLLRHTFYPEEYPVSVNCDYNGDGMMDSDDAIYLLRHTFYPQEYPLSGNSNN